MLSPKKINNLKNFYIWKNDQEGLFISFKLIWINCKKKIKPTLSQAPIKLLKTNRYVIPIPTENSTQTERWSKPLLTLKLDISIIHVYKYFDSFFKRSSHIFFNSFYSIYNSDILPNVNKFDSNFWFDILRTLNNVNWLLAESSFSKYKIKYYYSKNKFKFYSLIVLQKMFKIYINPNLPLKRKKTENFIPWQEGQAWLKIWEFIFKQLVFEFLGLKYNFSQFELKIFWQAQIDPSDSLYIWAFRRLHLLGLSKNDGKILSPSFFEIYNTDNKLFFELIIKNLLLKQFNHWKETFFTLAQNNKLIYDPLQTENFSFELKSNDDLALISLKYKNFLLYKYLKNKSLTAKNIYFTSIPIPTHFFGSKKTFFTNNFLLFSNKELNLSSFQLKKQKLNLSSNFINLKTLNYEFIKQSILFFNHTQRKNYKILINSIPFDSNTYQYLNAEQALSLLNNNSNITTETLLPIPNFLWEFFFLLTQPNSTFSEIDNICLKPFFKIIWSLYFDSPFLTYNSFSQLQLRYKIPSITFVYNIIWNVLPIVILPKKPFLITTNWNNSIKVLSTFILSEKFFNTTTFFKFNLKIYNNLNTSKLLKTWYYLIFLILHFWKFFMFNFSIFLKSLKYKLKSLNNWLNLFFFNLKKWMSNYSIKNIWNLSNNNLNMSRKYDLQFSQLNINTTPNFSKIFWAKSAKFIIWSTITKFWEKQKIYFIVNTMYKSFWYTNSFKYKFNILTNLYFFKYYNTQKFFNFFFVNTKISVKSLLLQNDFFFDFLKILYKIKYFFTTFKFIIKLQLK